MQWLQKKSLISFLSFYLLDKLLYLKFTKIWHNLIIYKYWILVNLKENQNPKISAFG